MDAYVARVVKSGDYMTDVEIRSKHAAQIAEIKAESARVRTLNKAAPLMLEALKAMVSEWQKLTGYGPHAANEKVAFARAVLEKLGVKL